MVSGSSPCLCGRLGPGVDPLRDSTGGRDSGEGESRGFVGGGVSRLRKVDGPGEKTPGFS